MKTDKNLPVLNSLKASNSSIRLIAFTGPNQVTAVIGGFSYNLTPNLQTGSYLCPHGFVAFQILNYNPVAVAIPDKVLDQSGEAHVQLLSTIPTLGQTLESDTVLMDNPSTPTDYYIFPVSQTFGDPNYNIVGVPRSTTPPAGVSNIKIRLVNLGSPVDTFHLNGPLTLTYMDGTPVSTVTTGVPTGVASGYTEIPYGAYHFRLFTQSGLEVPETQLPAASSSSLSSIHSFQPGGIYTIFVNSNNLYILGTCGLVGPKAHNVSGNTFTVIPDITAPPNVSYGEVQFVNTIPGQICSLTLNNFSVGNSVGYRGISAYRPISVGGYSMQLTDVQGQPLAQQNISINPNDNFTVWACLKNGQPALAVSSNDLSYPNMGQMVSFMNCSVNVPYITFTHGGQLLPAFNPSGPYGGNYYYPDINDSTSAADATQNLAQGVPATHEPFTLINTDFPVTVSQSDAGPPPFVPGITLQSIAPLTPNNFIFNPGLYAPGNPILTAGEPGVYTVALTGVVDTVVSEQPSMDTLLIVKHFK